MFQSLGVVFAVDSLLDNQVIQVFTVPYRQRA